MILFLGLIMVHVGVVLEWCGSGAGVAWELYDANHLGRCCGSDTCEEETSEVDNDFEGDFQPLRQWEFILTHDTDF